jgi:Tol biopolymer transport system component
MNTPLPTMPLNERRVRRLLGAACALGALLSLDACGGNNVDIASGQSPDPVALNFAIAYVKRPAPDFTSGTTTQVDPDARELLPVLPGGDLYVRARADSTAPEKNITGGVTGGTGDVRDLSTSYDGKKIVFALRKHIDPNAKLKDPPTWGIWEYNIETDTLRRIITSDTTADAGQDVAPHYLPDGRIIFSSTRQRQSKAILLDEGKPQFDAQDENRNEPAFVLHVMDADGTNIHQVSFNQNHDLDPSVLPDGRIVFTRWDNTGGNNAFTLYTMNPDGSDLELLYGKYSHDTGTVPAGGTLGSTIEFMQPRSRPDGKIVSLIRPYNGTQLGGDMITIDANGFVDNMQPTLANTGAAGPAQHRLTNTDVRTTTGPSPGGRFSSVFPLQDGTNRFLVSWSPCRVHDATGDVPCTSSNILTLPESQPIYGVWVYNADDFTQQPIFAPEDGFMYTDAVLAQAIPLPPVILDRVPTVNYDPALAAEAVGIINIGSVYDIDGIDTAPLGITSVRDPAQTTADQRPARFLRIEKAVSLPDRDVRDINNDAFGTTNFMREIVGYAPVEPDGSVRVKVPANIAFALTVLDKNGRRISPRHNNWLQVTVGEELKCNGCHRTNSVPPQPHGRPGLYNAANPGAPTTGAPFPNTDPALFANQGETMAETRTRLDSAALSPSVNVIYNDVWTTPANPANDFAYLYNDATFTTPAPTRSDCITAWQSTCRITINYLQHIQPLWDKLRQTVDPVTGAVLTDHTCTTCHSNRDAAGAVQLPAAQLELTSGPSNDNNLQITSYRELLFPDNQQELNMGALQDVLVPGPIDPTTGLPTLVPVTVTPSMSAAGANASNRFFSRFVAGASHVGYMSAAELRLVSEWLDLGAQYYNDPFVAPVN